MTIKKNLTARANAQAINYTFKLAIFDRRSMQYVGDAMSGVTEQEFTDMMITGGRAVEGNLYTSEEK